MLNLDQYKCPGKRSDGKTDCGQIYDEDIMDRVEREKKEEFHCILCGTERGRFIIEEEQEELDDAEIDGTEEKDREEEKKVEGEPPQLEFEKGNVTIRFFEHHETNPDEREFIFGLHNQAKRHIRKVLATYETDRERFDRIFYQVFVGNTQEDIDVVIQRYGDTLEGMENEEYYYFRNFKPATDNGRVYARAIHGALARENYREIYKGMEDFPDRVTILYPLFFKKIPVEDIARLVDNLNVLKQKVVKILWHRIGGLIHEATHHYANTDDDTPDTIDNGYYYGSFAISLIYEVIYEDLA